MSNKPVINKYMQGFRDGDHASILECLTDDIEWVLPGAFHHHGKQEFDREIENENFIGRPEIDIIRLTEENEIIVAELHVTANFKNGEILDTIFFDVFEMENGKIKKLTSNIMTKHEA